MTTQKYNRIKRVLKQKKKLVNGWLTN